MNVTTNASMSVIVRARERAVTANASMTVIVRARERAAQRTKIGMIWQDNPQGLGRALKCFSSN